MKTLKCLFLAIFVWFASPALAAIESEDLCSLEPNVFLEKLAGTWTVKQGPGRAGGAASVPFKEMDGSTAGYVAMALKAQPPVRLKMDHLPEIGINVLSGQGQEMVVVAAKPREAAAEIEAQLAQDSVSPESTPDICGEVGAPAIVATNYYHLSGAEGARLRDLVVGYGVGVRLCSNDPLYEFLSNFRLPDAGIADHDSGSASRTECPREDIGEGEMHMTIVAQFESLNSGSGHLYFSGEMSGAYFSAVAPVTFTR